MSHYVVSVQSVRVYDGGWESWESYVASNPNAPGPQHWMVYITDTPYYTCQLDPLGLISKKVVRVDGVPADLKIVAETDIDERVVFDYVLPRTATQPTDEELGQAAEALALDRWRSLHRVEFVR